MNTGNGLNHWQTRIEGYRCPLIILLWARSYQVIRRYSRELRRQLR